MAERTPIPTWVRSFHPADVEKNLNLLVAAMEPLLPPYPVITLDLPDTVEVTAGENQTFDLTVTAATRGTLSYKWQIKKTTTWADISGATSVDYTASTWDNTTHAGTYRCIVTNTFNNVTAITYSNECVATTAA